ncbi:MAG: hypothetical protein JO072_11655 [Parafilimonas sp.]|nr:hypothetical protein [Parafilimonas sp.]
MNIAVQAFYCIFIETLAMSEDKNTKRTLSKLSSSTKKVRQSQTAKQVKTSSDNKAPHENSIKYLNDESAPHHLEKWNHYLFEFLMLFLAVTAGFFVDNRREVYMEKQKANQFSKQLLADLRKDSLLFENRNRDIQLLQTGFDKLVRILTQDSIASNRSVLETLLPLAYVFDLPVTTTTYNQMKSSGALRYIESQQLTAHLQEYYDVLLPRSINIANVSLNFYSQNVNPFYLKHIRVQDYDSFNDTLINKNPVITERTKQTDQELANIMGNYRSLLQIQVVSMNNPALDKIKETMKILRDEYNID